MRIPFNKPYLTGRELDYIRDAHEQGRLSGDGPYTRRCNEWLERSVGCTRALLTHSCTGALEMAAILGELAPGDEVIMPSFTFVSTANAFALQGAVPVFADIRPDTLNLDERRLEALVTPNTRAIVPVHYAGVGCEMDEIMAVAERHGLLVVEDAAQALGATYRGRALGSFGQFATLSFHETKNVISGEGGALLVNSTDAVIARAEIVREKGTNRSQFFRGEIDKYTWVDIGSSYLPSEIIAAFLLAQLEHAEEITARRMAMWKRYHEAFAPLERAGLVRRPVVPEHCGHNAHLYYLLLEDLETRTRFIKRMKERDILCVFHYIPLHSSPYGSTHGRVRCDLHVTEAMSDRLVRLPLWLGLEAHQDEVISAAVDVLGAL